MIRSECARRSAPPDITGNYSDYQTSDGAGQTGFRPPMIGLLLSVWNCVEGKGCRAPFAAKHFVTSRSATGS
jgi:hypothetical protein